MDQKQMEAKIAAQRKTIDVLMDRIEQQNENQSSAMNLLTENHNLEQIIHMKTERLRMQREQLKKSFVNQQKMQTQLLHAQKMQSVGQLAAGIAHEINTPAQFITFNIEFIEDSFQELCKVMDKLLPVLKDEEAPSAASLSAISEELENADWDYLSEEVPKAILQTKEGIARVSSIVVAMKEFSHPGTKQKSMYDLNRIIETTLVVASSEIKDCASVSKDLDPNLPSVHCLSDEIGQVFLNLLVNAVHAIQAREDYVEGMGKITIVSRYDGDGVSVTFSDTGCGIPEGNKLRIFDPFFTTKEVGEGTGQGLAISHDVIVNKHNGRIEIDSTVGEGTSVIIHLPIGKDDWGNSESTTSEE